LVRATRISTYSEHRCRGGEVLNRIVLGSDITSLRRARFATGIQRVLVETHKNLTKHLNVERFDLHGFVQNSEAFENYKENTYLNSDPILKRPLVKLNDVDLALYLDINYFTNIKDFFELKKVKPKIKIISLVHDIFPILHPQWFPTSDEGKQFYKRYLQSTLLVADYVIVASEKVKRDILSLNWKVNGDIRVIPMGTYKKNSSSISNPVSDGKLNLIFVGTIEPRKGLVDLLDAFDMLIAQKVNVTLNIVGNYGWSSIELASRIKTHSGYGTNLFWHNSISDQQMEILYRNANFAVLPSYDEGFGLPFEEALSQKRIVIAREIDVFLERRSDNVLYFSGNGSQLARIILENLDRKWNENSDASVRTMEDFAKGLKKLIEHIFDE
jgi:glycosyltransferase involved in cell wall biosynthesis